MRDLSDCFLYGILDLGYVGSDRIYQTAQAMIDGGVDLIQLRGKTASIEQLTELASRLHELTSRAEVGLVVNDYPEIAQSVEIEGVHVGQDDGSIASVRKKVNRQIWVGKSTHSLEQAMAAQEEGADYIGFGPVYATPTKPDYVPIGLDQIRRVQEEVTLPVFCIGGIKLNNLTQVIAAGGRRVVIVSGLLQAADTATYARDCKNLLTSVNATTTI